MRQGERHDYLPYSAIVDRAPLRWPNGARVAFWVVPNIEHYELAQANGQLDVPAVSRTEYANRVGVWRIMEALDRHGMRGTVALNASVCSHYPRVIEESLKRGWEMMGHGLTNSENPQGMNEADDRELVQRTVEIIRSATGSTPRGWLGPGLRESAWTLDHLQEAGVEYACDWVNDDQPYQFTNGLWSIPYSTNLNDIRLVNDPKFPPSDFRRMIRDAFDTLYREGETNGRVMCLALHPFVTGLPSFISILDEALEYICGHDDVWLTTGSEILDWVRLARSTPYPEATP